MKLSVSIAILLIFQGISAFAQCPVNEGQVVQMLSAADVFKRLSATSLTKGEFETTAQFEARKAQAGGAPNDPILVETRFNNKLVEYDADNARFIVRPFYWGERGTFMRWPSILGKG